LRLPDRRQPLRTLVLDLEAAILVVPFACGMGVRLA
jgi:hypothetical protein